jgi:hypothetical protein
MVNNKMLDSKIKEMKVLIKHKMYLLEEKKK